MQNIKAMLKMTCDTTELEEQMQALHDEMDSLVTRAQNIVAENSRVMQNQEDYQKRYDALVEKHEKIKKEYDKITTRISSKLAQREQFKKVLETLEEQDGAISEFDEGLWCSLVDHVTVYGKEDVKFTFKNGIEIKAK